MAFIHLHNHSDYSLLDGAQRISEIVEFARTHGMGAIALTDHGNMMGMVDFFNACQEKGVKAIPGQECYFTLGSRRTKTKEQPNHHMTVLAMNKTGYHNLCKLSSLAYIEGFYYKPRIDWELLEKYHEGLIILSGCLRGVPAAKLAEGDRAGALEHALNMKALLGPDRYYIELMNANLPEQKALIGPLADLAREAELGLVATNDCHYPKQKDAILQELLICIASGKTMDDPTRLKFSSQEFYLKTEAEMRERFPDHPEALANTQKIADMVNVSIKRESYHLPHFEVPKGFATGDAYLRHLAEEGLKRRLSDGRTRRKPQEAYWDRLEMELDVIQDMAFPGYFLILQDILAHSRRQGIPVGPGRGSSAGSLVSYALEIVDIDPLEYDLIFERFLNPARISMPDIDVDVCQRRRGEVLQYIREKFGEHSVCQIVTFKPLKSKGVVRDVARILGLPFEKGDVIAKAIPDPKMTIEEAKESNPALKEMERQDDQIRKILEYGQRLTGLNRNLSVHAAGVVITPGEASDFVPLAHGPREEEIITQYTFEPLEKLGLLKMDILGLATLTVVYDTLADIRAALGVSIDPMRIPLDDGEVFALFGRGRPTASSSSSPTA